MTAISATQASEVIRPEGSSALLLRHQPETLQKDFSEGDVGQYMGNNLGRDTLEIGKVPRTS